MSLDINQFMPHSGRFLRESNTTLNYTDPIKPSHYNSTKISTFDIVNDWGLNFFLGNVIKYIQRAGKKEGNSELQDLKKANEYLTEYIKMLEVK